MRGAFTRVVVASAVILGAVGAGAAVDSTFSVERLEQSAASLHEKLAQTRQAKADAKGDLKEVTAQVEEQSAQVPTLAAVLEARPAFLEQVAKAKTVFERAAAKKVDITGARKKVLAAQDVVAAERASASVVAEQARVVAQVVVDVTEAIAEKVRSSTPATDGWFEDFRARLDKVGGAHVPLREFDGVCGDVRAVACTFSADDIAVSKDIASYSSSRKDWVAAHELAHTYQWKKWGALQASKGFQQLFGGDVELLANCMVTGRGVTDHGHLSKCTPERVAWAAKVYDGAIPW